MTKHQPIRPVTKRWPELFLWPVTDDPFTMIPIRWFDTWGEAADFVSANLGKVNLFVGEPKRRAA